MPLFPAATLAGERLPLLPPLAVKYSPILPEKIAGFLAARWRPVGVAIDFSSLIPSQDPF